MACDRSEADEIIIATLDVDRTIDTGEVDVLELRLTAIQVAELVVKGARLTHGHIHAEQTALLGQVLEVGRVELFIEGQGRTVTLEGVVRNLELTDARKERCSALVARVVVLEEVAFDLGAVLEHRVILVRVEEVSDVSSLGRCVLIVELEVASVCVCPGTLFKWHTRSLGLVVVQRSV